MKITIKRKAWTLADKNGNFAMFINSRLPDECSCKGHAIAIRNFGLAALDEKLDLLHAKLKASHPVRMTVKTTYKTKP